MDIVSSHFASPVPRKALVAVDLSVGLVGKDFTPGNVLIAVDQVAHNYSVNSV